MKVSYGFVCWLNLVKGATKHESKFGVWVEVDGCDIVSANVGDDAWQLVDNEPAARLYNEWDKTGRIW